MLNFNFWNTLRESNLAPNTSSQIYSSSANAVMNVEVDSSGNDTITFIEK